VLPSSQISSAALSIVPSPQRAPQPPPAPAGPDGPQVPAVPIGGAPALPGAEPAAPPAPAVAKAPPLPAVPCGAVVALPFTPAQPAASATAITTARPSCLRIVRTA
jgi:hypothetical protein